MRHTQTTHILLHVYAHMRAQGRFHTLDATFILVSRPKGQRSESPGPLMLSADTHRVPYILNGKDFKLGIQMEDDDPHQPQASSLPRLKVKVARLRD